MAKLLTSLIIVLVLLATTQNHLCDGSAESCDQCTSSLVELLEQANQDLKYTNKTIEKSRTSAKFGLKLEQLEAAYSEHATGLNRSETMYQQAVLSMKNFMVNKTNVDSTNEGAIKILDDLENTVQRFSSLVEFPNNYSQIKDFILHSDTIIFQLKSNLTTHLQKINSTMEYLERIDKNYLNHTTGDSKKVTIELGGGVMKKMIKESRALIRAQENGCDRLDNALDELNLWLKQVDIYVNYIKKIKLTPSEAAYSGVVSAAINLSQELRIEDLEEFNQMLQDSIDLAKNIGKNFIEHTLTLKSNESEDNIEKISSFYTNLNLAHLKKNQIAKNLAIGSNQLSEFAIFQNGSEAIDMSTKLRNIKTNLVNIDKRISDKWLEHKPKLLQRFADADLKNLIEEYENLTRSEAWQGFFGLERTIDTVNYNVNSMIDTQTKIEQLHNPTIRNSSILIETRKLREIVSLQLMNNISRTANAVAMLETELMRGRSDIVRLNDSIANELILITNSTSMEGMKYLTERANSSTASIHKLVERTQRMIDEFLPIAGNFSLTNDQYHSKLDSSKEILEYLSETNTSRTFDNPQIFTLAAGLFNDLNETLSVKVNRSQASELTRLSSSTMQQVSVRLRNKIQHARSLINQFCQVPDYGTMVSFPRPKSNISSYFVQSLNLNHELDELMLEHNSDNIGSYNMTNGHIRQLSIRFRSLQQNGLLVHHSRPDHSSFMSVYITGGRLMLAVNFDKKIRIESHISLSDGQWHTLQLIMSRRMNHRHHYQQPRQQQSHQDGSQKSSSGCNRVKHTICAILDGSFTYRSRLSVCFEPISSKLPKVSANTNHREPSKRSVESVVAKETAPPDASPNTMANLTERLFNHANNDETNWEEQSKKILYFGGVEDKYIPLLRNQQIPTNFHGCIADVTINNIRLNFLQTKKNQAVIVNHCQPD